MLGNGIFGPVEGMPLSRVKTKPPSLCVRQGFVPTAVRWDCPCARLCHAFRIAHVLQLPLESAVLATGVRECSRGSCD